MNRKIMKQEATYDFLKDEVHCLYEENKKLKELCNKYEEEHNTTFKVWQDTIKRINNAVEYIENNWIEYSDFQYVDNDDELNIDCESIKELLDILKGSDTNGNN